MHGFAGGVNGAAGCVLLVTGRWGMAVWFGAISCVGLAQLPRYRRLTRAWRARRPAERAPTPSTERQAAEG